MAKKSSAKKTTATRSSHKRERINTGTDVRFVKRRADGTFKESDDVGRSQRSDRARKAKKTGEGRVRRSRRPFEEALSLVALYPVRTASRCWNDWCGLG